MNKSLYTKLVLIMLFLILSLMTVVGAFLVRGIRNYYLNDFYEQMQLVFSSREMVRDLRAAADNEGAADIMADILRAYTGVLGIGSGERDYYILNGSTGAYITGSGENGGQLEITPNILTAISGKEGYAGDSSADYMDVALPISGGTGTYIVYIKDNKSTANEIIYEVFEIIIAAMAVGLIITTLLSLVLAKTMATPIQRLTRAAEKVAAGDFTGIVENDARDEIGVLTRTFNNMARQLETTLDNLRKSEQMRREFVANVSHELRTPITSIKSYAETLEESVGLPPETEKQFLGVIVNETDRMAKIVQDLLTLSRFDAGSFELSFEEFSLEKSVGDVYSATLLEAKKHGHEFLLKFKNELPNIYGDRARIEQVIMNMVSNAVKYTPDGGVVRVTAGHENDVVWVSVRDNGVGIPKQDVEHVFERFYRVDKARSRESGGTGLGLSIAREIVTRHGGEISITSREGRGTTITMTLPVEGPKNE